MTYFSTVKTLSDLKKEYNILVLENHPDVGGDASIMRMVIEMYKEIKSDMQAGVFVPYVPVLKPVVVKKSSVVYDDEFDLDSFMQEDIYEDSVF